MASLFHFFSVLITWPNDLLYLLASHPDSFFFLQIGFVQIRTRHCLVHFNVILKQPNFNPGKSFSHGLTDATAFWKSSSEYLYSPFSYIYIYIIFLESITISSAAKRRHCSAMLDSLHGWFSVSHLTSVPKKWRRDATKDGQGFYLCRIVILNEWSAPPRFSGPLNYLSFRYHSLRLRSVYLKFKMSATN